MQKRMFLLKDFNTNITREFTYLITKGICGVFMKYSDLKCKEVINIRDCKRLGRVMDMEFDECTGCIHTLIVPGICKPLFFVGGGKEIVIRYKDIKQIGPDIILVDICLC